MISKLTFIAVLLTASVVGAVAQRPQGPPRGGRPDGRDRPQEQRDGQPRGGWIRPHDANQNGVLEAVEFRAAADLTFKELDRNGNGVLDGPELQMHPHRDDHPDKRGEAGNPEGRPAERAEQPHKPLLPPFFFADKTRDKASVSRAEFDQIVTGVFNELDQNNDGALSAKEADSGAEQREHEGGQPAPQLNAKFVEAARFGDKLVPGQPFSADSVIEDTRRLYDGTTVTKQSKGAVFRDSAGRTRREQPLELVGGVSVSGPDNKPVMLIFINDFPSKTQYSLDQNQKTARKIAIPDDRRPLGDRDGPKDAKTEPLGTKTIEGLTVEGTRLTFEIPAGQLGNQKPIQVVDERWFSPELQVLVYSSHLDPIAGEHVYKLVNIKRSEPAAELFTVPSGYKVDIPHDGRRGE